MRRSGCKRRAQIVFGCHVHHRIVDEYRVEGASEAHGAHVSGHVLALRVERAAQLAHPIRGLDEENLTVEYRGQALSRYEIALQAGTGRLTEVGGAQLFETAHRNPQPRLFDLSEILWLRALRANDYAPRTPYRLQALQEVLFSYAQAF